VRARVAKLITVGEIALVSDRMGQTSLDLGGSNLREKIEVDKFVCVLKTNVVSAKGSLKLMYGMKSIVKRTTVAFQN